MSGTVTRHAVMVTALLEDVNLGDILDAKMGNQVKLNMAIQLKNPVWRLGPVLVRAVIVEDWKEDESW